MKDTAKKAQDLINQKYDEFRRSVMEERSINSFIILEDVKTMAHNYRCLEIEISTKNVKELFSDEERAKIYKDLFLKGYRDSTWEVESSRSREHIYTLALNFAEKLGLIVIGIIVIVLLGLLCRMMGNINVLLKNSFMEMMQDLTALREKLVGSRGARGRLLRKEMEQEPPLPDVSSFPLAPSYPDFLKPPPSLPVSQYMKRDTPDFDIPLDLGPILSVKKLKETLERKPNWNRTELLQELGLN